MAYVIASIAQKGGVGKSSLAHLVAQGYASSDYSVLLADMDTNQKSSVVWNTLRQENAVKPTITVKAYRTVNEAVRDAEKGDFDLLVFDGAPHATTQTLDIARQANIILLPTGASKFDLDPQINLAHELVRQGIPNKQICFVLSRLVASDNERQAVLDYLGQTPYKAFSSYLEEKTGYRHAAEFGKAMTETNFKSLNARSQELFGNISATLLKLTSKK
jgi:chromosome partitioning protein